MLNYANAFKKVPDFLGNDVIYDYLCYIEIKTISTMGKNKINWERRRWEAVLAILSGRAALDHTLGEFNRSIIINDAEQLVKELREKIENGELSKL